MKKYEGTYGLLRKVVIDKKLFPLDWPQYYAKISTYQKDLKALTNTVTKQPSNTKALSILGYILATTGNKEQAKVIFTRLIQRVPNDEFASFMLQLLQE